MQHTTHPPKPTIETSYMVLIEFLMLSKRRVVELGAASDLTAMQTMMLFMLDVPRPMNNFSKIFNCDASNITGLMDGLEQKKLASRYESPTDRRIKMVKLNPKGGRVRADLLSKLTTRDSPIMTRLSAEEFEVFVGLLQKITQTSS